VAKVTIYEFRLGQQAILSSNTLAAFSLQIEHTLSTAAVNLHDSIMAFSNLQACSSAFSKDTLEIWQREKST